MCGHNPLSIPIFKAASMAQKGTDWDGCFNSPLPPIGLIRSYRPDKQSKKHLLLIAAKTHACKHFATQNTGLLLRTISEPCEQCNDHLCKQLEHTHTHTHTHTQTHTHLEPAGHTSPHRRVAISPLHTHTHAHTHTQKLKHQIVPGPHIPMPSPPPSYTHKCSHTSK